MEGEFSWNDRYAGDEAWSEWFRICSVAGCGTEVSDRLRAEISSAMFAHLSRAGVSREAAGADDPVAVFDAYFCLHGSRDKPKPLKAYFAHRIADENLAMSDFVCGTLFGSSSGRVRDIVLEWVSLIKGWKPRSVRTPGGARKLVWENAGFGEDAPDDRVSDPAPVDFLDEAPPRELAEEILAASARRAKASLPAAALMLYVAAHDISVTEPIVLAAAGCGKSQAYAMKTRMTEAVARELRGRDGADSPAFGRILLSVSAAHLPREVRGGLGADA